MARILIVEDERPMQIALADSLQDAGYRVFTASDGEEGLRKAAEEEPDLVLLDIMLPKLDGFSVCHELRRLHREVPVIMLTAKDQVGDRVTGLDAGADDYLVKPFSMRELLARIRVQRKLEGGASPTERLVLGDVEIDFKGRTCRKQGRELALTAKEMDMLKLMARTPNEPVTRERFLDAVWGYASYPTTRTVDTHIAGLRNKLEAEPDKPTWIKTVHRVGYKLDIEFTKP